MDQNLPAVLPGGTPHNSGPIISARRNAQNLDINKTQQQKDAGAAAVSMHQVITGQENTKPTTSVYRAMHGDSDAITSVAHQGEEQHSIYGEDTKQESEARDYRRYSYVKRLIKARKDEEAKVAKEKATDKGLNAGIGRVFRKTGPTSFKRRFKTFLRQKRATYKNISKQDAELMTGIVETTLSHKPVGSDIHLRDRKKMKMKGWKSYRKGDISKEDLKDFKKIVGQLD